MASEFFLKLSAKILPYDLQFSALVYKDKIEIQIDYNNR